MFATNRIRTCDLEREGVLKTPAFDHSAIVASLCCLSQNFNSYTL